MIFAAAIVSARSTASTKPRPDIPGIKQGILQVLADLAQSNFFQELGRTSGVSGLDLRANLQGQAEDLLRGLRLGSIHGTYDSI